MPPPTPPTVQFPGIHHKRIGDVVVTAINDGMFEGAFAMLTDFPAAEAEALHRSAFRAIPPKLAINCFLIQTGKRLVLVDSGFGGALGPLAGHLADDLRALGVAPADIDTVLCTHLHPDHVGGLVDSAGAAQYPNAELVVHEADHTFWGDDATLARATTDQDRGFVQLARATIAAYADRTRLLKTGEALPGISILPEPGHTPGHSGWLIASGGESLLIWGDVVHMPGVQFARPDAGMGFDVDGPAAIETRKRIMDMTATDRLLVAGASGFPGVRSCCADRQRLRLCSGCVDAERVIGPLRSVRIEVLALCRLLPSSRKRPGCSFIPRRPNDQGTGGSP